MRHLALSLLAGIAGIALAGCVSMHSAYAPGPQPMGTAQKVVYAHITHLQETRVNVNRHQLLATGAGAATGGVLGSLVGGGRGKTLAEIAGVLAGGAAGHQLGKGTTKALRITLKTQNGDQYAVLEPLGQYHYHVGERVEVVGSSNRLKVIPVHNYIQNQKSHG